MKLPQLTLLAILEFNILMFLQILLLPVECTEIESGCMRNRLYPDVFHYILHKLQVQLSSVGFYDLGTKSKQPGGRWGSNLRSDKHTYPHELVCQVKQTDNLNFSLVHTNTTLLDVLFRVRLQC